MSLWYPVMSEHLRTSCDHNYIITHCSDEIRIISDIMKTTLSVVLQCFIAIIYKLFYCLKL